ncbi:hypothetical protein DUI70_4044 [Streptomyces albus]|nr:hypothetical protein DUI70_4044 [Streptomyces albus]
MRITRTGQFVSRLYLREGVPVAGAASSVSAKSASASQPLGILARVVAHFAESAGGSDAAGPSWLFFSAEVGLVDDGELSEEDEQAAVPSTVDRIRAAEAAAARVRM